MLTLKRQQFCFFVGILNRLITVNLRENKWVLVVSYVASFNDTITQDDRSGRVTAGIDIHGAHWWSYLQKNSAFWKLSTEDQEKIEGLLPLKRIGCGEPQTVKGVWQTDKSYSRKGVGVQRRTFKPL